MDVKFPILSILSTALILFFISQGDSPMLHSIELGLHTDGDSVSITVDPVLLVWSKADIVQYRGHTGLCIGNVIAAPVEFRNTRLGCLVLSHELNHILQYRALGSSLLVLSPFLNLEGEPFYGEGGSADLSWLEDCNHAMWLPPSWWVSQWHYIALSFR